MPREFKTILCPTDFSEESAHAIEYGVRFASLSQATILLTHIIHLRDEHYRDDDGHIRTFDTMKVDVQLKLQEFRDKYVGNYEKCQLDIEVGDPYEVIMKIANERHVDLIALSTHGQTLIDHLVKGSVAEKVVRHAPCPVFVVRRGVE